MLAVLELLVRASKTFVLPLQRVYSESHSRNRRPYQTSLDARLYLEVGAYLRRVGIFEGTSVSRWREVKVDFEVSVNGLEPESESCTMGRGVGGSSAAETFKTGLDLVGCRCLFNGEETQNLRRGDRSRVIR